MKITVAVFFGCSSVEHEVSIISGVQAMRALDREKYDVLPVYVAKNGDMLSGETLFDIASYKDIPALYKSCRQVWFCREGDRVFMKSQATGLFKKPEAVAVDIALPVVHGTNCEDGSLAGFFEVLGLPYAGCDVASSAVGMDKNIFKRTIAADGLPVLPAATITSRMWLEEREDVLACVREGVGYPAIIKPVNLGSSVGISKVSDASGLEEAMELAFSFTDTVLAERAIVHLREINCSVLGDREECAASPLEEPVMHDEILSYKDKYLSGGKSVKGGQTGPSKGMSSLQRKLPADLSSEKTAEIQELAVRTFRSLGCSGVVRIDFLLDTSDDDRVYVNEINTIPGSLAFYLWEAGGLPYRELLDRMLELGFKRERRRKNLMFTIDTNLLESAGDLGGVKGAKGR
ncbi:MAG: D-alanine--D-alanine ligase family protein [Candidatus Howiella sp.]|jgi:D-alanine-D-alanine ligase